MVTFDHREPGTAEQTWVDAGILTRPHPLDLEGVDELVVLAAHPDDESFGAAGLLHRLGGAGVPVTVVVATDGEASYPGTADVEELRTTRRGELVAALAVLAPSARLVLLGLPDGGLREHRDELRRGLDAALAPGRGQGHGQGTLLVAPWRGDGHRDHRVAGETAADVAAARDARLAEYPIWWWHWGDPASDGPWQHLHGLRLTPTEVAAKAKALAAHATQVALPTPGTEPVLGAEMLRHAARPVEVFVVERAPGAPPPPTRSLDRGFFDTFYAGRTDPWGFETRWYEERKRAVLLAALPRPRFRHGLEIGCSTGVLTAELAHRCDRVTGVDIADAPLDRARRRLGDTVELLRLDTPARWPDGTYDLIVLSEVLYYYDRADLDTAVDRTVATLDDDGVVVACHWRHEVPEYPLAGDEVHDALRSHPGLDVLVRHEEEDFVLEVLVRRPARSVARETGLV
ncbi:hypothetical protein GCM10023216_13060 [Isoptericola chiayiensis]|uniref:LmbE family protein n=1 Tax=Isoptericola chiayiensis TaxID=579446 RepID=A0ABP8YBX2_9MICO|nr:LmbE family N-acetylglucosaminyl deacetylase [Isoptericola chiayiensis]